MKLKKILIILFWIFILASVLAIAFSIFAIHTVEKNIRMFETTAIFVRDLKGVKLCIK